MTPDTASPLHVLLSSSALEAPPIKELRVADNEQNASSKVRSRDLSIDYLRTTLTLMVIAHHSSLAYTTWAVFDKEHVLRSTAPVVDSARWIVLNYAENFNDVFFMSLMFFVSGLFAYPAIRKHGALEFARDRMLRLGVPFAVAVCVFMPIAFYASWQLGLHDNGFQDFYIRIAKTGFLVGPPWFIWVLLLFDLALVLLLLPGQKWLLKTEDLARGLEKRCGITFAALLVLSGAAYLPLLSRYGFGTWTVLWTLPFAFQKARIGLYALWFVFGTLVGVPGFTNGLLSREGNLARNWRGWTIATVAAYGALSLLPGILEHGGLSHSSAEALRALLWVVSCTTSCFGVLGLFRGVAVRSTPWMNSLSRSAYVMYLVHYIYITWTQRLLLHTSVHASVKVSIVFVATVALSWLTAQLFIRIPAVKSIV
jgi:glucan biosynthesis protein C